MSRAARRRARPRSRRAQPSSRQLPAASGPEAIAAPSFPISSFGVCSALDGDCAQIPAPMRRLTGKPRHQKSHPRLLSRPCGGPARGHNIASMVETVISIRAARLGDEGEIATVHDAAWREAYRGVIPGRELERMIARRGPEWWRLAIARRTPLLVLEFGDSVVGYISYGRNRVPALGYGGEIFELYRAPADSAGGVGFSPPRGGRVLRRAREPLGGQRRARFVFGFG